MRCGTLAAAVVLAAALLGAGADEAKPRPPLGKLKPDTPQNVVKYWERVNEARDADLRAARESVVRAKAELAGARDRPLSERKTLRHTLTGAQEYLGTVQKPNYQPSPPLTEIEFGEIGRVVAFRVERVLDAERFVADRIVLLALEESPEPPRRRRRGGGAREVTKEKPVVGYWVPKEDAGTYVVEMSTAGLVPGHAAGNEQTFEVATTELDGRAVTSFRLFDLKAHLVGTRPARKK